MNELTVLTPTQRGTAGEELFAACVTLSSDGDLELFKPLTDDDHTDVTAGRRGKVPALAIQVKTALSITRQGFAVARMNFPDGKPRKHPAFVYAIVYVVNASVEASWIVPSGDFNRLTIAARDVAAKASSSSSWRARPERTAGPHSGAGEWIWARSSSLSSIRCRQVAPRVFGAPTCCFAANS